MAPKSESRITEESVLTAIEQGAKSPTGIAKMLGFKSGSSSVIKRILIAVPDLRERLTLNDVSNATRTDTEEQADRLNKADASGGNVPANQLTYPIPDCVPYRQKSGYAKVWSILYAHRQDGITKKPLIENYRTWSGKPKKNCEYDVQVVCSPRQDGTCNRSAAKASKQYWVERKDDLLLLHLIDEGKQNEEA